MPKIVTFEIDDATALLIEERVVRGDYKSAQACFDEAMAGFRHNEAKRDRLFEMLDEGLASGASEPFDMNEILAGVRTRARRAA